MGNYIYGIGTSSINLIGSGAIELNNIECFIETRKRTDSFMNKPVINISEIKEYDYIIVAVKNNIGIYEKCMEMGINIDKVCFIYPCNKDDNADKSLKIAKDVLSDFGYAHVCENYGVGSDKWIYEDALKYESMNTRKTFEIREENNYYISADKFDMAGSPGSYFWQDLWAAKRIVKLKPEKHYDIGSRVDGFIAHLLSAGIVVSLIDVRPLDLKVENLEFVCADATNLDTVEDDSIESLSALCSLEHFGLGRYGDPIDPEACFKCFDAIQKKVKLEGNIYISVPIGKEHIEFNAHRIFYAKTIVDCFNKCELVELSSAYNSRFERNIKYDAYDFDDFSRGARFGMFHFVKKYN